MAGSDKQLIDGPAGRIESAFDWPERTPLRGVAVVGHPHPLFGGTMDNKVVTTISRAFNALDWLVVRPNFRGVGRSEGEHADGEGETDDLLHLVDQVPALPLLREQPQDLPVALAGFSFGSFVAARAARTLSGGGRAVRHLVLVGVAAGKWPMPPVREDTLIIHGEQDETIPLADVFEWARPQDLPVIVIPGADHFFHRRLTLLKRLISGHLISASSIDAASQTH